MISQLLHWILRKLQQVMTVHPYAQLQIRFLWNDSRSDSFVLIEKIFFFFFLSPNTVTELTIIATLGCKCQHFCVSLALLGSTRQHPIDVSACTGPGQPHMSIFIRACTWKKPQLHNRIACTLVMAASLFCSTSLTQIRIWWRVELVVQAEGGETVVRPLGGRLFDRN